MKINLLFLAFAMIYTACEETSTTISWDENRIGEVSPSITAVDPASYRLTGTGETIKITGMNFLP
ncbi:MAG: hypothetical protein KAI81_02790, partial [Candidatus Marinimicrobia bacterium]|nr:hypothetical protein [Candidatus Neomarinimicrobiota bacterium]